MITNVALSQSRFRLQQLKRHCLRDWERYAAMIHLGNTIISSHQLHPSPNVTRFASDHLSQYHSVHKALHVFCAFAHLREEGFIMIVSGAPRKHRASFLHSQSEFYPRVCLTPRALHRSIFPRYWNSVMEVYPRCRATVATISHLQQSNLSVSREKVKVCRYL